MSVAAAPRVSTRRVPGDVLLHPVALAAVAVLLVNDHYLKHRFHGLVPGKVSDFAGLVFFPLLALAIIEGARRLARVESWSLSRTALAWLIGLTAVVFALVKLSPGVADAYSSALGVIEWPVRAAIAAAQGNTTPTVHPVRVMADATDLVALPALAVTWFVGGSFR